MERDGFVHGARGKAAYAALELLALASGALFLLAAPAGSGSGSVIVAFLVMGIGSGFGWVLAGRVATGCIIALVRAVAVPVFAFGLFYAFASLMCERAHCASPSAFVTLLSLIGFLVVYFAIPVGSAIALLVGTRDGARRAA
jgi:hypothetical protein